MEPENLKQIRRTSMKLADLNIASFNKPWLGGGGQTQMRDLIFTLDILRVVEPKHWRGYKYLAGSTKCQEQEVKNDGVRGIFSLENL